MAHFHSVLPQQGVNATYCSWDSRTEPTAVRVSGPPQVAVAVVVDPYVYMNSIRMCLYTCQCTHSYSPDVC